VICSEIIWPQMRSKASVLQPPSRTGGARKLHSLLLAAGGQFSLSVFWQFCGRRLSSESLGPPAARAPQRGFLRFNKHCSMRWPQSTILPVQKQFLSESCAYMPPHSHKFNAKMRKYFPDVDSTLAQLSVNN